LLEDGEAEFMGHERHVVSSTPPAPTEYFPDKQSVHAAWPVSGLYFPATHNVHIAPFAPVDPALHVHAERSELPSGALDPIGQLRQTVSVTAPSVVE